MTRHQYGISGLVSQSSIRGKTSGCAVLRNVGCFLKLRRRRKQSIREKLLGSRIGAQFPYPTVLCIKIARETSNNQAGATQHLPLSPWAILTLLEIKIQEEHKSLLEAITVYHSTQVCCLADKNYISNTFSFFFFITVIGEGNAEVKNDDDADAEKDSEQQEKLEEKSPKR